MMNNEARVAAREFVQTGRIRVIVQDNGSVHKSQAVKQRWCGWKSQGLYILFLPEYCSKMNKIELKWQQFKTHEIAGRMFEDELDLAYAVIDGIQAISAEGNYITKRFK